MKKNLGFTLVELIVVITILAILGTIAFVSFQGYSVSARDSIRISELRSIVKVLDLYQLKNNTLPRADDAINITASGKIIGYQGHAGSDLFKEIGFSDDGLDPLDNLPYTYYSLATNDKMQLMGLMEKSTTSSALINNTTFSNFNERFPKTFGTKLGLITDSNNVPVNTLSGTTTIDIVTTSDLYIAHIDETRKYQGMGDDLRYSVPKSSCQRLADLNLGGASGYYTIYPIDDEPLEVYCRFEEGNGYTLIARSVDNPLFNGTPFGWFISRGSIRDDSQPYSLGAVIKEIPFQEVRLGVYNTGKTGSGGETILSVTDVDLFDGTYSSAAKAVNDCEGLPITIQLDHDGNPGTARIPYNLPDSCAAFAFWGKFDSTESYFLSNDPSSNNDGLNRRRYGASFPYQGMIFVK